MSTILLVGQHEALLEGLVQSLVASRFQPVVAFSLLEARELAARQPPLMAVVDRAFAAAAGHELLTLPLAPRTALVLYTLHGGASIAIPAAVQRAVLAELTLPLERNRLIALAHSLQDRARSRGRIAEEAPPESHAP